MDFNFELGGTGGGLLYPSYGGARNSFGGLSSPGSSSSNYDRLAASTSHHHHHHHHRTSYYDSMLLDSLLPSLRSEQQQLFDDIFFSDEEENAPRSRLPLFSRCPLTNRAQLETPGGKMKSASLSPLKNLTIGTSPLKSRGSPAKVRTNLDSLFGLSSSSARIPLLAISNQQQQQQLQSSNNATNLLLNQGGKVSYSQVAKKPTNILEPTTTSSLINSMIEARSNSSISPLSFGSNSSSCGSSSSSGNNMLAVGSGKPKLVTVKPSLDDVKDDSIVALTNKHGKGKYWFKSGSPTPDPRWPACQQLMIGPIPGDVEYSTLRSAFLSKGHTIHLFIQNNQAWLEKNQEKFGKKQVKFGYVVYTDSEVAKRLLAAGHVMVGHAKVAVKEMDGQPAQFVN